ncbi:hypothetical protein MNBD_GAMMA12-2422, partial [hydrothermal vent metagenome]
MLTTKKLLIAAVSSYSFISQPIMAADWTENITIKGFASAVYQISDDPVFFNGDCQRTISGVSQNPCDAAAPAGGLPGTVNGITSAEGGINEDGSFRRTRIGLNINARVNDNTTVQTQFMVLEEASEYKMILDWGFISIDLNEKNSIRAGKLKMPVGLVNEFQNVGFALPWIEAPQLFYTTQFNGPN